MGASTHPAALRPPPEDLDYRSLPITTFSTQLFRVYTKGSPAIPPLTIDPTRPFHDHRFSGALFLSPVCYSSETLAGAFVETCLDDSPEGLPFTFVASGGDVLEHTCYSVLQPIRPLRLVDLTSRQVIRIGATHALETTSDYSTSQRWAAAFHRHPQQPDGILYRPNLSGPDRAIAIFGRAFSILSHPSEHSFTKADLDHLQGQFGFSLV